MRKSFIRRILAASMAVTAFTFTPNFYDFNFMPVACAKVETYEGIGEYIMSKKETPEFAEKTAKEYALRDAQEKAGFFLKSTSIVKNNNLEDEIIVIAANILRVADTVPELIPLVGADSGYIKCRVTVKANIDTDELKTEIDKLLKRDTNERSDLVEKNKLLQKMLDDANKRNAELEKLIANAKTEDDKKIIDSGVSMVTNDAQVIEKVAEGNKFSYEKNYDKAIDSYGDAMKFKVYEAEGTGKSIMSSELEETSFYAKKRAKLAALQNAADKIGVFVSKNGNGTFNTDTIYKNLYIIDLRYIHEIIDFRGSPLIRYTAVVKVKVRSEVVDEWVANMKKDVK